MQQERWIRQGVSSAQEGRAREALGGLARLSNSEEGTGKPGMDAVAGAEDSDRLLSTIFFRGSFGNAGLRRQASAWEDNGLPDNDGRRLMGRNEAPRAHREAPSSVNQIGVGRMQPTHRRCNSSDHRSVFAPQPQLDGAVARQFSARRSCHYRHDVGPSWDKTGGRGTMIRKGT